MLADSNGLTAFPAGDGDVDLFDFAEMQTCFGAATGSAPCDQFDTNTDGWVDETDYAEFQQRVVGPQ